MDRAEAKVVSAKVEEAIKALNLEGYEVGRIGGSFDANGIKLSIRLNGFSADGNVATPERVAMENMMPWQEESLGVKKAWLDKTFTQSGTMYKVTGFAPRRRRYPISVVRVKDNRPMKFTAKSVAISMGKVT